MAVIVMQGGEGLVVPDEANEVLEKLRGAGAFVELETQHGILHLNPASVAFVKEGDAIDPVRDTPGPSD
jgi:hypothetical protein